MDVEDKNEIGHLIMASLERLIVSPERSTWNCAIFMVHQTGKLLLKKLLDHVLYTQKKNELGISAGVGI